MLIYNPRAGRFVRGGEKPLAEARQMLERGGGRVELRPTTGPNTAGAMARAAIEGGADRIVVAGGDGTINEAAQGMLGSDVPLGILPAGTANVLATELRLGRGLVPAVERLEESHPHRVAVGRLTCAGGPPRSFLMMAGIGLDAHVVYRVDPKLKARSGKFAYWVAGWSLVGRPLSEFRAVFDGRDIQCSFVLAARVRNYGGDFEIARETTLFDDAFEVVLFEGRNSARYVKYFAGMVTGRLRGMAGVTVARTKELALSCPSGGPVYVQIDGELAGRLPARIEMGPETLNLLMPRSYWERAGH